MAKVHMVAEKDMQESSMLDYYVTVRREDNGDLTSSIIACPL